MDIIFITELELPTVIGIYSWERQIEQTLYLDLELATDIRAAAASDHIDDTLDYKTLTNRVREFAAERRYALVESLAEEICALILREFPVPWVRLRLNKRGALRHARDVGILIERHREEPPCA